MTAHAVDVINPVAQTMEGLILHSELIEVRRLAREAELDPMSACIALVGCAPEVLSRRLVARVVEGLRERVGSATRLAQGRWGRGEGVVKPYYECKGVAIFHDDKRDLR